MGTETTGATAITALEANRQTMSDAEPRPAAAGRGIPATVPVELFDEARRGRQRAFDAIFTTYQPGLLRYLRTVAPDLATEVASATWESVVSSLGRFDGDGTDFRRWLFTIARRRLVDEVRRASRRPLHVANVPDGPSDAAGVDAPYEGPDWAVDVLGRIPIRQADVVALRVIGGLSVGEAASLLGITAENVRVLSHRGLNAIRQILADDDLDIARDDADEEIPIVV
jgi:RNA polymerase sigma factor (sigma-70 family)